MPLANCPTCGYDTAGLPGPICPECGNTLLTTPPPAPPRFAWRAALSVVLVLASVAFGYAQTFLTGVPTFWGVQPLTVMLAISGLELSRVLGSAVLALVFGLIVTPIMLGSCSIRWWSRLPTWALLALAWVWFVVGATFGVTYQSLGYVIFCGIMQLLFTGTFIALWRWNQRTRTFASAAAFHGVACIWLASYAFPYLGELP